MSLWIGKAKCHQRIQFLAKQSDKDYTPNFTFELQYTKCLSIGPSGKFYGKHSKHLSIFYFLKWWKKTISLSSLSMKTGAIISFVSFGVELKMLVQDLTWIIQGRKSQDLPYWGHMDIIDLFSVFISCVCSAEAASYDCLVSIKDTLWLLQPYSVEVTQCHLVISLDLLWRVSCWGSGESSFVI